jgi:hypothetical protein
VTFKEYQKDHIGVSWEKYVDVRFCEAEKALELSRDEMNRRLEGMNEIRSQLDRQASTFVTKDVMLVAIEKIEAKIDDLQTDQKVSEARNRIFAIIVASALTIIGSTISGTVVYYLTRGG